MYLFLARVTLAAAVLFMQGRPPTEAVRIGPQLLSDQRSVGCALGPLQLSYRALASPIANLQQSGDVPLPALGPTAPSKQYPRGTFFPPPGYLEGGTFPAPRSAQEGRESLLVAEWNVARGQNLDRLITSMRAVDADVWILNETDLYGGPAAGRVVARELARALGYSYVTSVEFYELRGDRRGMSGNAIVSRYALSGVRTTYLPMYIDGESRVDLDGNGIIEGDEATTGGHDWGNPNGFAGNAEPRCGQRSAVSAYVEVPNLAGATTRINLISVHTENFEAFERYTGQGPKIRWLQVQAARRLLAVPGESAVLAGDFNTLTVEPFGFRDFLKKELQRVGARLSGDSGRPFVDCSFGDLRPTHKVGVIPTDHLDWILLQEGDAQTISCSRETYRIINSRASDHMIVTNRISVRRADRF